MVVIIGLVIYGAVLGSFAGAQVWRLRARQLVEDKAAGEPYDKAEYRRLAALQSHKVRDDRSRCLDCEHTLQWYDLVPLISWLSTGGKCRYCRRPIGRFEPTMEIGMATLFVVSYLLWPLPLTSTAMVSQFIVWLAVCVVMVVLFAYDAKWYLLPNRYNIGLAVLGVVFYLLGCIAHGGVSFEQLVSLAGAIGILSGIYLLLYWYSRGKWIGFGDVKLGVGLGLLAGQWQLGFLALFLANLFGVLFVIPLLLSGRLSRKAHIPFGPFLIVGTIVAVVCGQRMIDLYLTYTTSLFL